MGAPTTKVMPTAASGCAAASFASWLLSSGAAFVIAPSAAGAPIVAPRAGRKRAAQSVRLE